MILTLIICFHTGLFLAAGHEGSGLTLSPATAELLAAYILHDQAPSDLLRQETVNEVLPATRLLMANL
jgi:glycine/D-amino acid oxidase-like deaminating enzyme